MSDTPIYTNLSDQFEAILKSAKLLAAIEERLAILEIVKDELNYCSPYPQDSEIYEALYRVARAIEARHQENANA